MSLREQANDLVERCRRVRDEQAASGKERGQYRELTDVLTAAELGAHLVIDGKLAEDDYHLGLANAAAVALEPYGEVTKAEIERVQAAVISRLKTLQETQPLSRTESLPADAPKVPEPRQVTGDLPSEILASALAEEDAPCVFGEQDPGGDL